MRDFWKRPAACRASYSTEYVVRNGELRPVRKKPTLRAELPIRLAAVELIGTRQWLIIMAGEERRQWRPRVDTG